MRSVIAAAIAAKLVIVTANGVAVTDYSSMERCEAAKAALDAAWLKHEQSEVPNGYHLIQPAPRTTLCIPG